MKYEFNRHVGFTTFNAEGKEKMFQRMCEVLDQTGVEVFFNILPKKDRHYLCPIGAIKMIGNELIVSKVSAFSRSDMSKQLSKNLMIQIIKKALKNKMRVKDTTK
jgi:hypothetical protein